MCMNWRRLEKLCYSELYIIWPPTILITNDRVESIIRVAGVDMLERTKLHWNIYINRYKYKFVYIYNVYTHTHVVCARAHIDLTLSLVIKIVGGHIIYFALLWRHLFPLRFTSHRITK